MLRSLLAAIDGSPQSQSVLDLAAQYSKLDAARLYVLLSVDSAYTLPSENGHIKPADEQEYPAASSELYWKSMAMWR
ncbi:universal stress protein [Pseudomonas sp. MDT1-16]